MNGSARSWAWRRYILAFGPYGWTRLMVWANSLDDALDEAVDWLAENAPGLLANDQVREAFEEAKAEGLDDDAAHERATEDVTCAGNHGDYIPSHEWFILAEDPDRETVLRLQRRL